MKKYISCIILILLAQYAQAQCLETSKPCIETAFEEIRNRPDGISERDAQRLYLYRFAVDTVSSISLIKVDKFALLPFTGTFTKTKESRVFYHDGERWQQHPSMSEAVPAREHGKYMYGVIAFVCLLLIMSAQESSWVGKKMGNSGEGKLYSYNDVKYECRVYKRKMRVGSTHELIFFAMAMLILWAPPLFESGVTKWTLIWWTTLFVFAGYLLKRFVVFPIAANKFAKKYPQFQECIRP